MQVLEKVYKCICCANDALYPEPYNFDFGKQEHMALNKERFESNYIRTSKYRWYNFLPILLTSIPEALILQFYRLANIFFLVIAVLQTISVISPLTPLSAWTPLIIVLAISMIRQGYEDFQRYKSDQNLNHQCKAEVYRKGTFVQVEWQEVAIGDICRVKQKDLFPADLILLASQHGDGNAFIETASLDGQKNLKPRSAYPQTQVLNTVQSLLDFEGRWEGAKPDKNTENFQSSLHFRNARINYKKQKQLLWRGTRLMNTKWIYGLVIYTGRNTKIMKNSQTKQPQKMSQIQSKVNSILGYILLIQIVLSIICGILSGFFNKNHRDTDTYIQWDFSPAVDGILQFFAYFVLVNTMIPISLIVSIEIVKMTQSYFISQDKFMHSGLRDRGVQVRTASLNQELGQIEYVFSDKTGTLTTNRMQFKIAAIGTQLYGDLSLIIPEQQQLPQNQVKGFKDDNLKKLILAPDSKHNEFRPQIYVKDREQVQTIVFKSKRALAHEYFTALSITHEVVSQIDQKTNQQVYQGPSPDEITLVEASKEMNFEFIKSTADKATVKILGEKRQFQILQTFPFNSDRKRMSIVIRDKNMIKMYVKGADSIIKKRLARQQTFNLDSQLQRCSVIGLRTLLIAMRIISEHEYQEFKTRVNHLPSENKDVEYQKLASELQQNLYLIGATAVLDRLQDEVPETIRDLIRANIKVWMLTGDKMQTAENIANSCNLIQPAFHVLKCGFPRVDKEKEKKRDKEREKEIQRQEKEMAITSMRELRIKAEQLYQNNEKISLMIEGSDLAVISTDDGLQDDLMAIAEKCQSVVCCRMLPIQKAEVVKLVRDKLQKITLAIGDGANDVPMIKAAHIGIGLFGQEGMAAVQGSDYALPQFRMLWRLLLVHGRWNYIRIAEMILYFFYKNMLFTLPQFLYAFYCGYSGQTIFQDFYVSLYNLAFTSVPLVIRAVFQQDVYYLSKIRSPQSMNVNESNNYFRATQIRLSTAYSQFIPNGYVVNKYLYRLFPKIYYIGQDNCIFNHRNFFMWVLEGVFEAVLVFFFAIYVLDAQSLNGSGRNPDMWTVSMTIYSIVILIVTFKLSTHTKFMSTLYLVCLFLFTIGTYVGYMWISNYFLGTAILGTAYIFFTSGETYFLVLYGTCLVLLLDGLIISLDYDNSGVLKRLRDLIYQQKQFNESEYQKNSIKISVGTVMQRNR